MEWENSRESTNVEDRRGDSGGFGIPMGGGTGGLGIGAILILAALAYFTGVDPRVLIGGAQIVMGGGHVGSYSQLNTAPNPIRGRPTAPGDQTEHFVKVILAQTEDVWAQILPAQKGVAYVDPKLVTYRGSWPSGCGQAEASMGPFYCPNDRKVYLDLTFFNDMKAKYGGGGDFAYAYVIAHEVGHHVQNLLGILDKAEEAKQGVSRTQVNAISVRIELMADCLAGVWAANADEKWHVLDPGDVEEALATAAAIGDDRLQTAARGYAVPDSFTHGSSALRQKWLNAGLKSGQIDSCNTFAR